MSSCSVLVNLQGKPAFLLTTASFLRDVREPSGGGGVVLPERPEGKKMTAETREQHANHRRDADAAKPRDTKSQDTKSQGIVRDERGQEQPTDKERAQRTSKSK